MPTHIFREARARKIVIGKSSLVHRGDSLNGSAFLFGIIEALG